MKAMAFTSHGSPEVLQLIEVADPLAGPGQVRVRVKAAGVQPYDCAVRQGWTPAGVTLRFPMVVGNEFAGVVDQIGEGVTGFAEGDEVLGFTTLNSYAERLVVGADQIVAKPQDMPWAEAGATNAAQTAQGVLRELGVGQGETMLIHAAAGGVGTMAVQLARLSGATVIGTASEANHDYLRSLGAIPVAYGDGLVDRVRALAPGGVDAALDGAGGEALLASLELVRDKDRILTLVEHGNQLGVRRALGKHSAARLGELVALYAQGKLKIHVSKTYALHEAADAHRKVETGHVRGKVVLLVD